MDRIEGLEVENLRLLEQNRILHEKSAVSVRIDCDYANSSVCRKRFRQRCDWETYSQHAFFECGRRDLKSNA